ncbi:hypothetical protein MYE_01335 [Mycoplasma yeatsii GM274B]|uniref:Uncharacterized protein n=1 Tax=Mycoplasma yeatsii TaxID=51365 RepID=A0ABU0NF93_9MOLU|nr:hypothetical protein MYE_01335 [Mycoplasma yeatsii GM274B]MDQ0568115.1 hypothetical protein [Mycoplasma yeatsii]
MFFVPVSINSKNIGAKINLTESQKGALWI